MKYILTVFILLLLSSCDNSTDTSDNNRTSGQSQRQTQMQALGKKLFFDTSLSSNANQSCASCHDPATGFADPLVSSTAPVSMGSVNCQFGNRNAPTAAYAVFTPFFSKTTPHTTADGTVSTYQGGQFLDGRRNNLMLQAKDPFLNPVEMNNSSPADVVNKVSNSNYASDLIALFGSGVFDNVDTAYSNIARAIAAFEASAEVNPFSSKFDDVQKGLASFTASEQRGFNLFKSPKAKCANCHTVAQTGNSLFTNHRYYNIGTPSNPDNPAVQANSGFIDIGLAGNTQVINAGDAAAESGKFRTPTLRNIEKTAPYMHNGVYQTLEQVINHYDIRISQQFTTPEVNNALANELTNNGNALGLQTGEITDLVNFLKTLSDR